MSTSINQSFPVSLFLRNVLVSTSYFIGVFILFSLIAKLTGDTGLLNETNLINWDAGQYYRITHFGYNSYLIAFFPLFPFIWKIIGFSTYGIVLFNAILFILSASILATTFRLPAKEFLFMLSFPSLIFMFLPYTEAVFFFSSTLILAGMKKKHNWLIFVGMLLASFTRPVAYVFIPALLVIYLVTQNRRSFREQVIFYFLPVFLGLAIVLLVEYISTGDWLAFFHSQKTGWNNYLRLPQFHFTSWAGDNIVRLDATAFLVGMVATGSLVYIYIKKKLANVEESFLFSLLYLAGICWIVLFTRGGSMYSLNRFVYATPFFFIALPALLKKQWQTRDYVLIFVLLNAFWLLFGSYVHIQQVLKYLLLTLFLMCFLFISHRKPLIATIAYSICLFGNIILQTYFYYRFLSGGWIG